MEVKEHIEKQKSPDKNSMGFTILGVIVFVLSLHTLLNLAVSFGEQLLGPVKDSSLILAILYGLFVSLGAIYFFFGATIIKFIASTYVGVLGKEKGNAILNCGFFGLVTVLLCQIGILILDLFLKKGTILEHWLGNFSGTNAFSIIISLVISSIIGFVGGLVGSWAFSLFKK